MHYVTTFPPSVMIEALAIIEEICKEFIDDGNHSHCKYKGPFAVLDRAQHALVVLQNLLFAESTKLDMENQDSILHNGY
jgi:hypothetical protein